MFFFKRSGMEKKEMLLLMMPAATGMFYIITSERSRSAVLKKTDMYLNDMVPQFELMEFAMEIILLAAIMSMLWLYQKLRQEQEKKQSDRLLLQEVRSMRAHIEEVERLQEHLRGMRHDMKNHISVLQGLMERGAFAHAQTYLDSMGRSYSEAAGKAGAENSGKQMDGEDTGDGGMQPEGGSDSPDRACGIGGSDSPDRACGLGGSDSPDRACGIGGSDSLDRACGIGGNDSLDRACGMDESGRRAEIRTGNPVTDVILAEHQRRIAEAGAAFWADFHYPDSKEIDVFDLSVILDNALTNAREALPQNGWVLIRSFREHHAYLIVIENAFEGELAARGAEGLPMTTKQPPEEHGFGLRHIKTIVEHYHGAVTMEQKGDMVRLSVMLCV